MNEIKGAMKKKIILASIALSIITILGIMGIIVFRHMYSTIPTMARKVGTPLPVRVISAEKKTLSDVIGARGEIQATSITTITSNLNRRIKNVFVEVGDYVKKGGLLIKFDDSLLTASLSTAEEDVIKTTSELENTELYLERMNRLYSKKVVAKIEVEDAENKVKYARLNYVKAKENLIDIKNSFNDTTVVSPVNGVILERIVNNGEIPAANQPMMRIGTSDSMLMVAYIDERKLQSIRIGQAAEVVFDAYSNDVYTGQVVKIAPQIDNKTATFPVFIKIKGIKIPLKHGLTGAVRIKNTSAGLSIPSITIINPVGDHASLFVVDKNNIAHLRPIKIGTMAEGFTEIISGLEEGERVVTVGQLYLHDNDIVRIGDELNEIGDKYAQKKNIN